MTHIERKRPTYNISTACNQWQAFLLFAFPPQEQRFLVLTLINMFLSTTGHVFLPYLAEWIFHVIRRTCFVAHQAINVAIQRDFFQGLALAMKFVM